MKYLKIVLDPIKIKGDEFDRETLQVDLYEKIISMCEAETLGWDIDLDETEEEDFD